MLHANKRNRAVNTQASDSSGPTKPTSRGGLRKSIPKLGNLLLWMLFCVMSGTGLLLAYRLPPGSRGGRGLSALGWLRHDWGDLHFWISIAFLALLLVHLGLHWRWFWQIASKRRAWPLLAGIGAGLALMIGLFCLPVKQEVSEHPAATSGENDRGKARQFRGGRE
jgi:hypothetical protein